MLNLFGRQSECKELRNRAIQGLKAAYPNIKSVKKDDTEYDLLFTNNGRFLVLKILFSHDFPIASPGTCINLI